jgi:hypothetical protein
MIGPTFFSRSDNTYRNRSLSNQPFMSYNTILLLGFVSAFASYFAYYKLIGVDNQLSSEDHGEKLGTQ